VLVVAIPSNAPYSGDGIVGWFGVLGVLHSGKFTQVPLRFGRQFVHGWPAFTHAQFIQSYRDSSSSASSVLKTMAISGGKLQNALDR